MGTRSFPVRSTVTGLGRLKVITANFMLLKLLFSLPVRLFSCVLAVFCVNGVLAEKMIARVVNGTSVVGDPPSWMLSLHRAGSDPSDKPGHFCGASLIHPSYAVTAAHCVYGKEGVALAVTAGRRRLSDRGTGVTVGVETVTIHPQYNADTFTNDVAVLKLRTALNRAPVKLFPVGLPSLQILGWGTVYGWGVSDVTAPVQVLTDILQQAQIPIIENSVCSSELGAMFDPSVMMCAGTLSSNESIVDGVDSCQGDSGGPLVANVSQAGSRLVGLVSWGYGCATSYSRGAYTRVEQIAPWVASLVPLPPAPLNNPSVSGIAKEGQTLTCKNALWEGRDIQYDYTWENEKGEALGTGEKLLLSKLPSGSRIRCSVTARAAAGFAAASSGFFTFIDSPGVNSTPTKKDKRKPRIVSASMSCSDVSCGLAIVATDEGDPPSGLARAELTGSVTTRTCATATRKCARRREAMSFVPQLATTGEFRFEFSKIPAGRFSFKIIITDNAGNIRKSSKRFVLR